MNNPANGPRLSISIVSHAQGYLIDNLLEDLCNLVPPAHEILLTINIDEDISFLNKYKKLPLFILKNSSPKGFGANHNFAFNKSSGDFFLVLNPDVRAPDLDLSNILKLSSDDKVGVCAPLIYNLKGRIEDNARKFPTVLGLINRVISRKSKRSLDYVPKNCGHSMVDWVGGMFMVFSRQAFSKVSGFDERYYMYMEDVDICRRLKFENYYVILDYTTSIVHIGQRASSHKFRHFIWHFRSAIRFFTKCTH